MGYQGRSAYGREVGSSTWESDQNESHRVMIWPL